MLALILICQPAPSLPLRPEPDSPRHVVVDVIIVNQYCRSSRDHTGKLKSTITWYDSFWSVHYLPPFGMCRVPVWCNRGWQKSRPLVRCDDGWACDVGNTLVTCPSPPLIVVSDFDFEYRWRQWRNPVDR